jgi:hypothetical protein
MEMMVNAYNILVGKPEGKRALGRPRRRWERNNRMDLKEVVWERDASGSGQGLVMGPCEHSNEPSGSI